VTAENETVSGSDKETDDQQARKALSEAGLVEIRLEEFAQRIRDVKSLIMVRLRELIDIGNNIKERESAAYSLGTLKVLELKLLAQDSKRSDSSES
jgi:hypothetical protein